MKNINNSINIGHYACLDDRIHERLYGRIYMTLNN